MNTTKLIDRIDINESEISKAHFYFKLKGIDLHDSIRVYLAGFTTNKVKYCEIATAYRYDKRVRKVLYKYIGLFEEHLRAYICNNYSNSITNLRLTKYMSIKMDKGMSLFKALQSSLFSRLVEQVLLLSNREIENLFPETKFLKKNLRAIINLRNAVSHNRFLLDFRDYSECSIEGERSNSFYTNVINFSNHLFSDIRSSFLNEINECSKYEPDSEYEEKRRRQTEWCLVEEIVLKV